MGAYLSSPVTEEEFENGQDNFLSFVTGSMQGWRTSQEDSHTCIINFENETSLFGVYDGHGGSVVAKLCATKLPEVIRNCDKFSKSNYEDALIESFLSFDESILSSEIQEELKAIAFDEDKESVEGEENDNEKKLFFADVLKKYEEHLLANENVNEEEEDEFEVSDEEGEEDEEIYMSEDEQILRVEGDSTDDNDSDADTVEIEENDEDEIEKSEENDKDEETCERPMLLRRTVKPKDSVRGIDSGCTAVVSLIDRKNMKIYVANAGDSRCVLCRDGCALDLSVDHKPEDEIEKLRIEKAGGTITADGRVNGGLNLSRAIGDHNYKRNNELPLKDQMISALPDVKTVDLTPEDEFMVIACDGIWNTFSSEDLIKFVKKRIDEMELKNIVSEIFKHCLAPSTDGDGTGCDNMTCTIVAFKRPVSSKRKLEIEDCNPSKIMKTQI